jgi:hypothetical protein
MLTILPSVDGRWWVFSCLTFVAVLAGADPAQPDSAPRRSDGAVATSVRIDAERGRPGTLYATVDGREVRVAHAAFAAWRLHGGREIGFSGPDGAGGYENEGQSLRLYDVRRSTTRKVLAAPYVIDEVSDVTTRRGRRALVVQMRDGGLGASHLAIVDPSRGAVFLRMQVKVLEREGDVLVVGRYREEDWERMANGASVTPASTERYDIDDIMRRKAR